MRHHIKETCATWRCHPSFVFLCWMLRPGPLSGGENCASPKRKSPHSCRGNHRSCYCDGCNLGSSTGAASILCTACFSLSKTLHGLRPVSQLLFMSLSLINLSLVVPSRAFCTFVTTLGSLCCMVLTMKNLGQGRGQRGGTSCCVLFCFWAPPKTTE